MVRRVIQKHILSRAERRRFKRELHRAHLHKLGWHKRWRHWRYKNTTLLFLSLLLLAYLVSTDTAKVIIQQLGTTGYLGAFVMGIFFVSIFTAAPACVVLFNIADTLHPIEVALLAGAGGVVGDFILFKYFKDTVFEELKPLFRRLTTHKLTKLFYTPYFGFLLPVMGMIFIASPGPDEVGIGLLGLSKIKQWQFLIVTFVLNSIGILAVVLLARSTS